VPVSTRPVQQSQRSSGSHRRYTQYGRQLGPSHYGGRARLATGPDGLLVSEAQRSLAPIQRLADVVSSYFVPAVIAAVITAAIWGIWGPEPRVVHALVNAVEVLIIACPCALGLATYRCRSWLQPDSSAAEAPSAATLPTKLLPRGGVISPRDGVISRAAA